MRCRPMSIWAGKHRCIPFLSHGWAEAILLVPTTITRRQSRPIRFEGRLSAMNGWVALGNGMAGFAVGLFLDAIPCVVVAPMAARAGGEEEDKLDFV